MPAMTEDKVDIPTFIIFFLHRFLQCLYVGTIIRSGPAESHSPSWGNPAVPTNHTATFLSWPAGTNTLIVHLDVKNHSKISCIQSDK